MAFLARVCAYIAENSLLQALEALEDLRKRNYFKRWKEAHRIAGRAGTGFEAKNSVKSHAEDGPLWASTECSQPPAQLVRGAAGSLRTLLPWLLQEPNLPAVLLTARELLTGESGRF